MSTLFTLGFPALLALFIVFAVAMVAQALHVFLFALRRDVRLLSPVALYELMVAVHLAFCAVVLRDVCGNWSDICLWFGRIALPAEPASWLVVLPLVMGTCLSIAHRRPLMLFELCALALWLPPLANTAGTAWPWLLMLAAAFWLFRSTASLLLDWQKRSRIITHSSLVEAVNTVPEGILCADMSGRVLLVNDRMRELLPKLGCKGLLSDARLLYEELHPLDGADQLRLYAHDGSIWRIVFDTLKLGRRRCWRMTAYEITEHELLNESLRATNRQLQDSAVELKNALRLVNKAAENRAAAQMRLRVHDIIGQRLSLLHRCLEDGDTSPQTLARLGALVDGIMGELAAQQQPSAQTQLASIVEAFALINVELRITGSLPSNPHAAELFVQLIREAATNAVRHAQAHLVSVRMSEEGGRAYIEVRNNGTPPAPGAREGTGIPGMRKGVEAAGGRLSVSRQPEFILEAVIPCPSGRHTAPHGS